MCRHWLWRILKHTWDALNLRHYWLDQSLLLRQSRFELIKTTTKLSFEPNVGAIQCHGLMDNPSNKNMRLSQFQIISATSTYSMHEKVLCALAHLHPYSHFAWVHKPDTPTRSINWYFHLEKNRRTHTYLGHIWWTFLPDLTNTSKAFMVRTRCAASYWCNLFPCHVMAMIDISSPQKVEQCTWAA